MGRAGRGGHVARRWRGAGPRHLRVRGVVRKLLPGERRDRARRRARRGGVRLGRHLRGRARLRVRLRAGGRG
ncbi:MAG: hypothetical protein ACK56F_18110, partial [bacterium]